MISALLAVVAAAVVWRAGTSLSRDADALARSTPLGRVFVGTVLLGVATSLPEIATTATAGLLGNAQLATGNLMGGVALQVVVLAAADALFRRPVSASVAQPGLLVQHVALLLMLSLAIAGMAVGEPVAVFGVGVWPVALVAVYAGSLVVARRGEEWTRWESRGSAPTGSGEDPEETGADRPPVWRIALSCGLILVAGWVLARSGDRLASTGPLNATFVGAALVALATSLPEVSTVAGALRARAPDLAVSNIIGTNTLEVALLFVADVAFREGALLGHSTSSDVFLAALAAVLTCLYLGGVLLRHGRTEGRLGYDSLAVILVYGGGLTVLALT